jgi:hypothetical protein
VSDPNDLRPSEYAHAQLTIAWSKLPTGNDRHFLFGQVELFSAEQPPPTIEPERSTLLPGETRPRVFVRRIPLSTARAVDWYEQFVSHGIWVRPDDDGALPEKPNHEVRSSRGCVEPTWPRLKLLVDDDIFGTVPDGDGQPLVSSSFPMEGSSFGLTSAQRDAASSFILSELGVDLRVDEALWKTAHLVAANPRIRRFDVRLETDSADTHDSALLLRAVLRNNSSFEGLQVQVLEHRDPGWWLLHDGPLESANQRVGMSPTTIDEIQWYVREHGGRLLQFGGPATFVRSIRMAARFVGARRTVHVPAFKRRAADTFTVDSSESPVVSMVGAERTQDGPAIFRAIKRRITVRRAATVFDQIWFDGGADEAAPVIRSLLSRIQESVVFVDPYIGPMELVRFVSAVPSQSAEIRVLGSMEGIRSGKTSAPAGDVLVVLKALEARAADLQSVLKLKNLTIRLMTGRRADVHDRFIVCDDQVWSLGSSLNEFGSRGTMLLRVPHSEAVTPRLEAAWSSAVALSDKISAIEAAIAAGANPNLDDEPAAKPVDDAPRSK